MFAEEALKKLQVSVDVAFVEKANTYQLYTLYKHCP